MMHTDDQPFPLNVVPIKATLRLSSSHKRTATHWGVVRHVRETISEPTLGRRSVHAPQDVVALCTAMQMQAWQQESFMVICLDSQHNVINRDLIEVTRGIVDSSMVHPREVFRTACMAMASSIILVHNHPSGDPTPSSEDRMVTSQLAAAGALLGIPVRDHVIIGMDRYVSFAEAGWMSA